VQHTNQKGRGLFFFDINEILRCYNRYMSFVVQQPPTYKQFINNMEEKQHTNQKGRGLFFFDTMLLILFPAIRSNDMWLSHIYEILRCYNRYMSFVVQQPPTYKQFINNMEEKMLDLLILFPAIRSNDMWLSHIFLRTSYSPPQMEL